MKFSGTHSNKLKTGVENLSASLYFSVFSSDSEGWAENPSTSIITGIRSSQDLNSTMM